MAKAGRPKTQKHELEQISVEQCRTLQRNPQYLTPLQMDSLKASIERDGFVAPILVRPCGRGRNRYFEIVSGNHRYMAAVELGYTTVPAVVARLDDAASKRLAINLNTVHGEPTAEQLAPFLAELDDAVLADIHLEDEMLEDLVTFDADLATKLEQMALPDHLDRDSAKTYTKRCKCPDCGKDHVAAPSDSE